jgi:hypothetical protein
MTHVPPSDILTRRVCLQLDGMDAVTVRRDMPFGPVRDEPLLMDLYYPSEPGGGDGWPTVVIVAGCPGSTGPSPTSLTYKEMGWTVSMARLIARSGMAAVAYTTREPAGDLERIIEHLRVHAGRLRLDASRLGVLAVSGNVPTALTAVLREARRPPVCAVFGYGCLLDLDGATDVAEAARQFGFANPGAGRAVNDLRRDVPLLVIRAGRDQFPAMNASIDRFVAHALRENLPLTLINHAEGPHAYDLFDDSPASRAMVRHTLSFLASHLTGGHQRPLDARR